MTVPRLRDTLIAAEAAACAVLLTLVLVTSRQVHAVGGPGIGARARLERPTGLYANGTRSGGGTVFTQCAVVRFAGNGCEYCRAGSTLAEQLFAVARHAGCEVIDIAPSRSEAEPRPGATGDQDLALVSMDWVNNRLNLLAEPTTLIVARGGKLTWFHVGELTPADLAAAAPALARAGGR